MRTIRLADSFVYKVVNRFIGVSGGYLGDFTRRSHREFYPEYCDLGINPDEFEGTTRERFVAILSGAEPRVQARILRGVLLRFRVGGPGAPESRSSALRSDIEAMIRELEGASDVAFDLPICNVDVVRRAIVDAETLLRANGATSAVDRIHTALHGFLLRVCGDVGIGLPEDPDAPLPPQNPANHRPAFRQIGPRSEGHRARIMKRCRLDLWT